MGEEENMQKLNFSINDGDTFYSNEMSVTFVPTQFAFDFKNISPRIDARMQDDSKTFVLKHNVVLIEPFQTKMFAKVLNDAIIRYEKEYGTIEVPPALKKIEAEMIKKAAENKDPKSHDVPSYFG